MIWFVLGACFALYGLAGVVVLIADAPIAADRAIAEAGKVPGTGRVDDFFRL